MTEWIAVLGLILYMLVGSILASSVVIADGATRISRAVILKVTIVTLFWLPLTVIVLLLLALERVRGGR